MFPLFNIFKFSFRPRESQGPTTTLDDVMRELGELRRELEAQNRMLADLSELRAILRSFVTDTQDRTPVTRRLPRRD